jgi:phage FluMu gp28-like protein
MLVGYQVHWKNGDHVTLKEMILWLVQHKDRSKGQAQGQTQVVKAIDKKKRGGRYLFTSHPSGKETAQEHIARLYPDKPHRR